MNKDESDQYLFVPLASATTGVPGKLYSIPALISGVSSNDITPIASGTPNDLYGNWKGGAVSDDLKKIITGNGSPLAVTINASLPLTAPWTKDVTVFAITNDPSAWGMDGIDFSHTSAFLFSNVYNSGNRNKIVKWNVVNLNAAGLALTTNTIFTSSLSRIRNVSDYYIGGKDLVYYGEGDDGLGLSSRKICVYDPSLGTETVLVTLDRSAEAGVVAADLDVMNVKVGGVDLGQMHLYVQCNDGALYIYNLSADGMSVGSLARLFSVTEMKVLLGVGATGNLGGNDRIRCIEFTNDEKFAFFTHAPSSGNTTLLHTVWTKPVEAAWWLNPSVKYCANTGCTDSDPHYMNKDEGDQYLFIPLFSSNPSRPGKLYSIPALIAAASSNDVSPIASGTPNDLYGNWKGGAISDALLRLVPGNGVPGSVTYFASLPLTAPWTKDTTGFAITNNPSAWGMDGMDFSHTSEFLFSNIYNSGYRNKIVKWSVINLNATGLAFVTNTVFDSSLTRIRNISNYYIGGKDLVFYGEGETTAAGVYGKVCVYDPSTGTETALVSGLDRGSADTDIMNVKVGGIGLGQMHLYVETNNGALRIYNLNSDGKSVGDLVRSFTSAQVRALLHNATFSIMRSFEVTNDEKIAFFAHHSSDQLYVVWTNPTGTIVKAL